MAKGSSFERWVCNFLSEWWTYDKSSSIFWRTAGSGARATVRGKRGRQTVNSYGDVMATDPAGQPLIDVLTIEIKRGYANETIANLLDKGAGNAEQTYETWIAKAERDCAAAGSFAWLLIHKRDRRDPLLLAPPRLVDRLNTLHNCVIDPIACVLWPVEVDCLRFADFFERVQPGHIQELAEICKREKKDATLA